MKKDLAIIGNGGHAKVIADIARACGWQTLHFFDDFDPALPSCADLFSKPQDFDGVFVAIGKNEVRLDLLKRCRKHSMNLPNLIHPSAVLSPSVILGEGIAVMPLVAINAKAQIADACILNTSSSVDHDCVLAHAVHISPGAHLAGGVKVGEKSWVGIGACVRENISIGDNIQIGAGAVVVSDLVEPGVYVGCPAKRLV